MVPFVTLLVSLSRFLLFGALEIKFDAVCPQCSSLSRNDYFLIDSFSLLIVIRNRSQCQMKKKKMSSD